MITAEQCPDCGANVKPNSNTCEYCGAAFIQVSPASSAAEWISIDEKLPNRSSGHPARSIVVLLTDGSDVVAAHYDFEEDGWFNDVILADGETQLFAFTHWMPIPYSQNDSRWIALSDRLPDADPTDPDFTKPVLTTIKGTDYPSSILSAPMMFDDRSWLTIVYDLKCGKDNWAPTHWMPLPELPES